MPNAPAAPQTGAPGVPSAPSWPQGGAPNVPHAPGAAQGGAPGWQSAAPARGVGQAAGKGLGGKLLGTATGKIIAAVLAVAIVAAGATAVIVARGGLHSGTTAQSAATAPAHTSKTPTPTLQPAGTITEFPLPTANGNPLFITTGPGGNLWFTEGKDDKIGRISSGK